MPRKPKPDAQKAGDLTPLELEFMRIVWDRGDATAAEIGEALGDARPLAPTTIHTVLANLRAKGFIEPIPTIERALRFAPRVPREKVAGRSLKKIIGEFFQGSPRRLMAHLVREGQIGEEELAEIRRLLNEKNRKGGKGR